MTSVRRYADPRWQKKRLEILERDNWTCTGCGSKEKELQVHHSFYQNGKKDWEHDNEDLKTLCCDCHSLISDAIRTVRQALSAMVPSDALILANNISGAVNGHLSVNEDRPSASLVLNIMRRQHYARIIVSDLIDDGLLSRDDALRSLELVTDLLQT